MLKITKKDRQPKMISVQIGHINLCDHSSIVLRDLADLYGIDSRLVIKDEGEGGYPEYEIYVEIG